MNFIRSSLAAYAAYVSLPNSYNVKQLDRGPGGVESVSAVATEWRLIQPPNFASTPFFRLSAGPFQQAEEALFSVEKPLI